ncbi:hypothetical protein CFIO01_00728 [Colletotrichum fioriniae PJ7]|uniref:Uncharacterized protein n=1 Tax=Colletotrichum fioriniae PJ7 TaxID=1445577 RepID=A0A010RSS4_9PEZI|nr:hypothetical protein CFIO01_00728 [Colletotrichum fioriniae PJ7]
MPSPRLLRKSSFLIMPLPLLPEPYSQRLLRLTEIREPLLLPLRRRRGRGREHALALGSRAPASGGVTGNHGRVRGAANRSRATYSGFPAGADATRGGTSGNDAGVDRVAETPVRSRGVMTSGNPALMARTELARGDKERIVGARGRAGRVQAGVERAAAASGFRGKLGWCGGFEGFARSAAGWGQVWAWQVSV